MGSERRERRRVSKLSQPLTLLPLRPSHFVQILWKFGCCLGYPYNLCLWFFGLLPLFDLRIDLLWGLIPKGSSKRTSWTPTLYHRTDSRCSKPRPSMAWAQWARPSGYLRQEKVHPFFSSLSHILRRQQHPDWEGPLEPLLEACCCLHSSEVLVAGGPESAVPG